jgi:hypothetical protein
MTPLPATEIEIDEFLAAFESGTEARAEWIAPTREEIEDSTATYLDIAGQ